MKWLKGNSLVPSWGVAMCTFVPGTLLMIEEPACIIMQGDRNPNKCLGVCSAYDRHDQLIPDLFPTPAKHDFRIIMNTTQQ